MTRYVNYNGRRYDLPSSQDGLTTREITTLERELRISIFDPELANSFSMVLGMAWLIIRRSIPRLTLDELYEAVDEDRLEFQNDDDAETDMEADDGPPTGASEEAGIPSSSSDGGSGPATSTSGSPEAKSSGSSPSSPTSGKPRTRKAA